MKKAMMIGLAVVIALVVIGGAVYAHGPWGHGIGRGTGADVENVKKFQKETLSLRDELLTKRLKLQDEYSKPEPNYDRIATLRKDIVGIQTKIQEIADKYGLPAFRTGMGHRMMGRV
ncbi:MAG TPA: hypothetical protein DEP99_06325 [Nitrospiraceae bacterium]|nr:hypothetical protein [Nitrospiraceae bacterium]